MTKTFAGALAACLLLAACNTDLTVPNLNNPTPGGIGNDPINGLALAATGILAQDRGGYGGYTSDVGIFGRESYNYFPTDGRSHTHFVAQNPLDNAGFASGNFAGRYTTLRNIDNFLGAVNIAPLTPERAAGARGFAETFEALELHYVIAQRHDYGAVVQINADARELSPFVSRDSAQNYIIARLDSARTYLLAAGSTPFFFPLHAGFTTNGTFNTPATFLQFNRAIAARVQVWRASLGNPACGAGGVTCYTAALAALTEAGVDTTASLGRGVYHLYSTESGDTRNGLNPAVNKDLLAHPSIQTEAPLDTLGQPDQRYRTKIYTPVPNAPRCPVGGAGAAGICTSLGFNMYNASQTAPTPIFRNEELILLQAEALYFTGSSGGALADINFIRRVSGGLAPRGAFVDANDFITELLLQRRYSLLWEGHRWVDVRRFGRIPTLPLDAPSHFRQVQQPVPQAECLQREKAALALRCPPVVPTPF